MFVRLAVLVILLAAAQLQAQVELLSNHGTGPIPWFNVPHQAASLGSLVVFGGFDPENGQELWVTDGTAAGTQLLLNIAPGAQGSQPEDFFVHSSGFCIFTADDGVNGRELWTTDGTALGTVLVKDIFPGSEGSSVDFYAPFGDAVTFWANDGTNSYELWRTDGTTAGTWLLADTSTGGLPGYPIKKAMAGTKLLFFARDANQRETLFKTSGVAGDFVAVKQFTDTSNLQLGEMESVGSKVVFVLDDDVNIGRELYVSDGTAAGTKLLKDIRPGSGDSSPRDLVRVGNTVYFVADNGDGNFSELWKTDGTSTGTKRVAAPNGTSGASPQYLTAFNGKVYYSYFTSTTGYEVWQSDGSSAGTKILANVNAGSRSSYPYAFHAVHGALFWMAADTDPTREYELWTSNGSDGNASKYVDLSDPGVEFGNLSPDGYQLWMGSTGSHLVWTSDPEADDSLHLYGSAAVDTAELLTAGMGDGGASDNARVLATSSSGLFIRAGADNNNEQFWWSDGTPGPFTRLTPFVLDDIRADGPDRIAAMGDLLFFPHDDGSSGFELWVAQAGVADSAMLLKDIYAGASGSYPGNFLVVDNRVYFSARTASEGEELWCTDGTTAGTVLVKDIHTGSGHGAGFGEAARVPASNLTVFDARTVDGNWHLYVTDGSESGTQQIDPTAENTSIYQVLPMGDAIIAWINPNYAGVSAGQQVVRTRGVPGDMEVLIDDADIVDLDWMQPVGSRIFFDHNGPQGGELYQWNETDGFTLVKDIRAGANSSLPDLLGTSASRIFFSAYNLGDGRELYTSDGTTDGTYKLIDLNPGSENGAPVLPGIGFGDRFFFGGNSVPDAEGNELWCSDGTPSGTVMVDPLGGTAARNPRYFAIHGDYLYFTGTDAANGYEVFRVKLIDGNGYPIRTIDLRVEPAPAGLFVAGPDGLQEHGDTGTSWPALSPSLDQAFEFMFGNNQ